ncbi:MBOAT, membrane-bound O-acyltransferase family-domain-containing protein [Gorgonomyces haynaldii]|nr:MBOAT, membrane-bound O-acyltransferase family-domain-containing protein [Gorgonomyces haynaldii]
MTHTKRKPQKTPFKAQPSLLDWETMLQEQNPMRGFFTLFWMTMAAGTITQIYKNWVSIGSPISLNLLFQMSKDGIDLIQADAMMVLSMFLNVFFHKIICHAYFSQNQVLIFQHLWQLVWFCTFIGLAFYRNWDWTQSASFTMHVIAMLMKQHSYFSYNTELAFKHKKLKLELELQGKAKKEDKEYDDTEINLLKKELIKESVSFPNNITFLNFLDYLLVPTLVYELEYPRTTRFRLWYFLERCFTTFVCVSLLYFVVEHWINPIIAIMPQQGILDSLLSLLLPFMLLWILGFYVIFECICNAFAELTCFADRHFYADWWNSTTYDEFARNWNKPVHEFLLRHVYLEGIDTYKLSKNNATFVTFFLSSLLHELVIVVTLKRLRLFFFFLQMTQVPLITIQRIPWIRRQKVFGNALFWFGMYLGPPLLGVGDLFDSSLSQRAIPLEVQRPKPSIILIFKVCTKLYLMTLFWLFQSLPIRVQCNIWHMH